MLSAANEFTSLHSTNMPNVWRDTSNRAVNAMLINCIRRNVNQRHNDIQGGRPKIGSRPPETNVLEALSQICELRIEALISRKKEVADIKLIRILAREQRPFGCSSKTLI